MKQRALITLFMSMFVVMVGMACIAPFLSIYAREFGANGLQISLIFAGFSISRSVFAPYLGSLSDKYGRRIMLLIGLVGYGLVSFAFLQAQSLTALFFCRFFQGVGGAMVFPVVLAYVGEISPKDKEGTYMGIINIAFFGGLGFGPLLGGMLYDFLNIQATFYFMGFFTTLAFIMALVFLPRAEPWRKTTGKRPQLFDTELLSSPTIQGIGAFRLVTTFGIGLNWAFLPLYAESILDLSGSQIGVVISVNVMISAILQGPAGMLADKLNRRTMVFWAGIFTALLLLLIPVSNTFWELFWVNLMIGIASGVSMPAIMALATMEGKKAGMGTVMGTVTTFHSLGMISGLLCGGLMFDWFGLNSAYALATIVGLTGSGFFLNRCKIAQV
jgi:DHA1 family multidrug resistance protein-like MFS transporter